MGFLLKGKWTDEARLGAVEDGEFKRASAGFRNWITEDGSPGTSGDSGFVAQSGRYHLYVAMACPWAHRTLIMRSLKDLESHIDVSVTGADMLDNGWPFHGGASTGDRLFGSSHVHELYSRAAPDYSGRATVPIVWDKKTDRIVSNESSEIVRMFNYAFNGITGNSDDYYPEALRPEIDAINDRVYNTLNNGVYRCGFSTTQEAYETAFNELFATLDWLEEKLGKNRYLTGNTLTEADWRLFPTLLRFDLVYFGHFKCNRTRISDMPNLQGYLRELWQMPGIADTADLADTKRHYYYSHESVNPTRIVPAGPALSLEKPHGREAVIG